MSEDTFKTELYHGLRALAESSFPKRCASCGRHFDTAEEYLIETQAGMEMSPGHAAGDAIEIYRKCPCGATLVDVFADRRDHSDAGMRRRHRFDDLLNLLEDKGIDRDFARTELIKLMQGIPSETLGRYLG